MVMGRSRFLSALACRLELVGAGSRECADHCFFRQHRNSWQFVRYSCPSCWHYHRICHNVSGSVTSKPWVNIHTCQNKLGVWQPAQPAVEVHRWGSEAKRKCQSHRRLAFRNQSGGAYCPCWEGSKDARKTGSLDELWGCGWIWRNDIRHQFRSDLPGFTWIYRSAPKKDLPVIILDKFRITIYHISQWFWLEDH